MRRSPDTSNAVKPRWIEHLWGHGNLFVAWEVRVTERLIMVPVQEANGNNFGSLLDFLCNKLYINHDYYRGFG